MLKPSLIFLVIFVLVSVAGFAQSAHGEKQDHKKNEHLKQEEDFKDALNHAGDENSHGEASHHVPPGWTVIPFIMLLLMIATGPLFYEHFWHKNYPIIAIALAIMVVLYYLFVLHNNHGPVHALAEYVQFISLLTGLFVASGGVLISVDKAARPLTNAGILLIGAVIANVIGTTGASMLLIRPYIRLNRYRIKPYHIIFFIFLVSNIGGCLTPIGDPPLFLGFLKGIPFFWTIKHNVIPWIFALIVLLIVFVFFDKNNKADYSYGEEKEEPTNKISISGIKNFFWLGVVVLSVFLDPNVFDWVPAIYYDGQKFSFMREIIMLTAAYLSFKFADKKALEGNDFSFEPIREVAFIFIGIFGTMMPALELVSNFAQSEEGSQLISQNTLYWGTGFLSGFLDNAPTYVNFLTAALASDGGDINSYKDVLAYARGGFSNSIIELKAISISAVFFGAMTYIGNGPNFMVKSIAEQVGIKMPSFFGYIVRFSIPLLIPLFIIVWLIFFAFKPVG